MRPDRRGPGRRRRPPPSARCGAASWATAPLAGVVPVPPRVAGRRPRGRKAVAAAPHRPVQRLPVVLTAAPPPPAPAVSAPERPLVRGGSAAERRPPAVAARVRSAAPLRSLARAGARAPQPPGAAARRRAGATRRRRAARLPAPVPAQPVVAPRPAAAVEGRRGRRSAANPCRPTTRGRPAIAAGRVALPCRPQSSPESSGLARVNGSQLSSDLPSRRSPNRKRPSSGSTYIWRGVERNREAQETQEHSNHAEPCLQLPRRAGPRRRSRRRVRPDRQMWTPGRASSRDQESGCCSSRNSW